MSVRKLKVMVVITATMMGVSVEAGSVARFHASSPIQYRSPFAVSQGRVTLSGRSSAAYAAMGTSAAYRLSRDSGPDGVAGSQRRIRGGALIAEIQARVDAFSRNLRRVGSGSAKRILTDNQMNLMAEYLNRLVAGDVDDPAAPARQLSPADLASIGLPGGWVLMLRGRSDVVLLDPKTGYGFRTWGDPHANRLNPDGSEQHYMEWMSQSLAVKLAGDVYVFMHANGAGAHFGEIDSLVVVSPTHYFVAKGLDTPTPTGSAGEGGLAAFDAYRAQFEGAPMVTWVESEHELRLADGSRMAPPSGAQSYAVRAPGAVVSPAELFSRVRLVQGDSIHDLPNDVRELGSRMRQAKAAETSGDPQIQQAGTAQREKLQANARVQKAGIDERQKLLAEASALAAELEATQQEMMKPGISARHMKELADKAKEIEPKLKEKLDRFESLESAGR